jgi:4-hydroxybenzoate polyprenyltransferase
MSPADHFRAHLALARISNTPTVVSNVLAGAVLAAQLAVDWPLVAVVIAMTLFYTAGMYLNDIFDYAVDVQERPERPLPSGRVDIPVAWAMTIAMLALGLVLLGVVSAASFLSGIILVVLIVVYDFWHKGNPVGPLLMAGTRVLVYVTAFTAYSTGFSSEQLGWCIVMLAYVAGLTSIAKTESLPAVGRYWPLVAVFLPVVAALIADPGNTGVWLLIILFTGWVLSSIRFAYRQTDRRVGAAIARLIAGISLVDALVLATHEAWWGVLVALVAFATTIFFQRYIRGT